MDFCAHNAKLAGRVGPASTPALSSLGRARPPLPGMYRASPSSRISAALKPAPRSSPDQLRLSPDGETLGFRDFVEALFKTNGTAGDLVDDHSSIYGLHPSYSSSLSTGVEEVPFYQVKVEERPSPSSSEPSNGNGDGGKDEESKERFGKGDDYYANVGYAIRTLRDDIPLLFMRDLNYDIYREDVVFKDPRNTFKGMDNYKLIFWSLRFHGRIFFRTVYVEIKRLWQIDDNCIRMRWTVHGFPRVPWEAEGTFDGVSEFKLDRDGKIYSHSVDNVIFRDPPGERLPLFSLNLTPSAAQQQAVPGGWCFGLLDDESARLLPYFSWVRLYLAIALLPMVLSSPKAVQESS